MRNLVLTFCITAMVFCASVAQAVIVSVPASWTAQGTWVDTGLQVSKGDSIRVIATGTVTSGGNPCTADGFVDARWPDQWLNPNSLGDMRPDPAAGGAAAVTDHLYALIGYIGSSPLPPSLFGNVPYEAKVSYVKSMVLLGANTKAVAPASGKLWLGINGGAAYSGNLADSKGRLSVRVSCRPVARKPLPAALVSQILRAISTGDAAKISDLLKQSPALLDFPDKDGSTPLHYAAAGKKPEVVKLLIDAGADLDPEKKNGVTPLHVAASLGRLGSARLLVAAGADARATDRLGRTALSLAQKGGHAAVATYLQESTSPKSGQVPNVAKPPSMGMITCDQMVETSAAPRWLTFPNSRLVVNPNVAMKPTPPAELSPSMPMNLALYAGERPIEMPYFLAWQPGYENGQSSPLVVGPSVDFSPSMSGYWRTPQATASFEGDCVRVTVVEGYQYGSIDADITVNLDETPMLLVQVPNVDSTWVLKVNSGEQPVDTYLAGAGPGGGPVLVDLHAATGWTGTRTFLLRLFSCGGGGASITCTGLRFLGVKGSVPTLAAGSSTWQPHCLVSDGQCGSNLKVQTTTYFLNATTVVQRLKVIEGSSATLALVGQSPLSTIRWEPSWHALTIACTKYTAAINVSRPGRFLGIYPSWGDWLCGRAGTQGAGVAWGLAFDGLNTGDEVTVAAAIQPVLPDEHAAVSPPDINSLPSGLTKCRGQWDRLLRSVPHPMDFSLHLLDGRGATSESIRRTYYKAWAFMLTDSIPPMPENGYRHAQLSCGKASLWGEGHPLARASAQWESFIAMQFLALVDPRTAWDGFEGMMSLVDSTGSLGGEGLPSRHAQTAWVLYSLTGDKYRLSQVYPAVKRLLLWKARDPRWIYANQTPADMKDAEFVVHALMDMGYAKRIAGVLEMPEEEAFWDQQIQQLADNYRTWFWDTPGGTPYDIYLQSSGQRSCPGDSRVAQGLALPPSILGDNERNSLLKYLQSSLRDDVPFLVVGLVKHPHFNLTMKGVWQYGLTKETAKMTEAALRSIALAGEFCEGYSSEFPVHGGGVTPDSFGAAHIIDAALWHNGVILGEGLPIIAHVPNAVGVENIMVLGAPINVKWDQTGDGVNLSGVGLLKLRLPTGFTASQLPDGGPSWQGKIPVGSQVSLGSR